MRTISFLVVFWFTIQTQKLSSLTETRLADVSSGVEIFNEVWQAGDSDLRAVQTYLASPSDTKVRLSL